ncbi:MAG: DUF1501 domain-containing protein [Pirellulales bacterium]
MLSLQHRGSKLCDGVSRREWLRLGGLSSLGLGLSHLVEAKHSRANSNLPSFGKAKSCILLFMLGGPPQHETWDPKPNASAEVRGEFASIGSATPGLQVGELMPKTAKLTDRIAVLRAMATDDNAHSSSGYWMLTGRPHAPKNFENALPGAPNDWPCLAAMVRQLRGDREGFPGSVRLPEAIWNTGKIYWPGQDAGWLGASADPWLLTCDPNDKEFRVPDISLPANLSPERFVDREQLQRVMNKPFRHFDQQPVQRWTQWQAKALDLMRSQSTQRAFQIDSESDATRQRYGRNRFGQSVLLARRMVEAGVSLVQVNWTRWKEDPDVAPAWDTHAKNGERLKTALMPPMDQAYSALLEDLEQRGMLDDTLVVWAGEFGRSPKINPSGGRDHWGHVFSAALAGGGIQGGIVHGQSDRDGAYPLEGRVEPQDLAATILHCLGIASETLVYDRVNRPIAVSNGQVIEKILA